MCGRAAEIIMTRPLPVVSIPFRAHAPVRSQSRVKCQPTATRHRRKSQHDTYSSDRHARASGRRAHVHRPSFHTTMPSAASQPLAPHALLASAAAPTAPPRASDPAPPSRASNRPSRHGDCPPSQAAMGQSATAPPAAHAALDERATTMVSKLHCAPESPRARERCHTAPGIPPLRSLADRERRCCNPRNSATIPLCE